MVFKNKNTVAPAPSADQAADCRRGNVVAKLRSQPRATSVDVSNRAIAIKDLAEIEACIKQNEWLRSLKFGQHYSFILESEGEKSVRMKGGVIEMPDCRIAAAFFPKCQGLLELDLRDNKICPMSQWVKQVDCSPTNFEIGKLFIVGGTRCKIIQKDHERNQFKVRYLEGRLHMQESAWLDSKRIMEPHNYKPPAFDACKSVMQAPQGMDQPIFEEGGQVNYGGDRAVIMHIDGNSGLIKVCQLGAVAALATAVAACPSLTSADFRGNSIPERGALDLFSAARNHPTLAILSGIPLQGLRTNEILNVDLSGQHLGVAEACILGLALSTQGSHSALKTLNLSNNKICGRFGGQLGGLRALVNALVEHTTLEELQLASNELGSMCDEKGGVWERRGGKWWCNGHYPAGHSSSKPCKQLPAHVKQYGVEMVCSIAVATLSTLCYIDLSNNRLGAEGSLSIRSIRTALAASKCVHHSYHSLATCTDSFKTLFPSPNRSLVRLNLVGNDIPEREAKELVMTLQTKAVGWEEKAKQIEEEANRGAEEGERQAMGLEDEIDGPKFEEQAKAAPSSKEVEKTLEGEPDARISEGGGGEEGEGVERAATGKQETLCDHLRCAHPLILSQKSRHQPPGATLA
jgi:hypothetical protein